MILRAPPFSTATLKRQASIIYGDRPLHWAKVVQDAQRLLVEDTNVKSRKWHNSTKCHISWELIVETNCSLQVSHSQMPQIEER
jgi:hypothetical protein